MIRTMKVIAVNKPHGTMTVMWNSDPELEWNYTVPTENGVALSGPTLKRWLVSEAYDVVKEALERRAANFNSLNGLTRLGHIDVSDIVSELEEQLDAG